MVYAAAALARRDVAWADAHRRPLLDLVRDYANPSGADAFFPRVRNKDWWLGHSIAGGLFAFEARARGAAAAGR